MITPGRSIVVVLVCSAWLAGCHQADEDRRLLGYVEADWVYVAAPQAGWIVERPVAAGSRLVRGDLLFRLDAQTEYAALREAEATVREATAQEQDLATGSRPAEIDVLAAQLAEAEAALDRVRVKRDRIVPLAGKGLESESRADEMDADMVVAAARVETVKREIAAALDSGRPAMRAAAAARLDAARAALTATIYRLEQRSVRAAVDGKVEEVFLEPGEFATAGAPVLAILPDGSLKARFFVQPSSLPRIRVGDTISVFADGLSEAATATISFIASEPEFTPPVIYTRESRKKLVFAVDARFTSTGGLLPGTPVEVQL